MSVKIKIYGLTQGIGFRHSAKKKAEELDLSGFIRNEPDGTAYLEAEGEKEDLEKFIDWCREGSPLAEVVKLETEEIEPKGFKNFEIII